MSCAPSCRTGKLDGRFAVTSDSAARERPAVSSRAKRTPRRLGCVAKAGEALYLLGSRAARIESHKGKPTAMLVAAKLMKLALGV
jgi:hypothetical protein